MLIYKTQVAFVAFLVSLVDASPVKRTLVTAPLVKKVDDLGAKNLVRLEKARITSKFLPKSKRDSSSPITNQVVSYTAETSVFFHSNLVIICTNLSVLAWLEDNCSI